MERTAQMCVVAVHGAAAEREFSVTEIDHGAKFDPSTVRGQSLTLGRDGAKFDPRARWDKV